MAKTLRTLTSGLMVALVLSACTSLPEAEELPEGPNAQEIEIIVADSESGDEDENKEELPVKQLRLKDVRGGQLDFELSGSPEQVLSALLDFEHADGHRAWAPKIEALGESEGQIRSRWHFDGEMGINPSVVLGFKLVAKAPALRLRFRILEPDFGLAAFFGDYLIEALPGETERSRVRARMFIDSGVTIANASYEEIAAGLREDAKMLEAWMKERLSEPDP